MNATEQRDRQGERTLVVIPDANVLIHGKALIDLPWAELGRSQIEVLFVPPVIRELDKLKIQTGRQNKIARHLSSDIRELTKAPGRRAEVRRANPTIGKRVELSPVSTSLHPALRLDHADQALINYALWLKQEGHDVLLITDDTICGTTAQEVGLEVHFLPESWLRLPEPDETAKENARLKAENLRLNAVEPKVELAFQTPEGAPLTEVKETLTRWPALTEAELDALMADVQRLCPQATSFERPQPRASDALFDRMARLSAFSSRTVYEAATAEEIETYKTESYPKWLTSVRSSLASLHDDLEMRTEWPLVVAVAANTGTRPAAGTLLTIQARGTIEFWNDDRVDETADEDERPQTKTVDFHLPLPPAPPRGRTRTVDLLRMPRFLDASAFASAYPHSLPVPNLSRPKPRDSDAFYWRVGHFDWVGKMELECENWRHGQEPLQFELKVRPAEQVSTAAAIEISVHANNIADPRVVKLPVRFDYREGATLDKAHALVARLGEAARAKGFI